MATRIGIDVGGTFTDLIFYDDASGTVVVGKESTTPLAPDRGVLAYLTDLQVGLPDRGYAGELLVTRSGGGAMTFAEACERPFETILSGPVAGAQGDLDGGFVAHTHETGVFVIDREEDER